MTRHGIDNRHQEKSGPHVLPAKTLWFINTPGIRGYNTDIEYDIVSSIFKGLWRAGSIPPPRYVGQCIARETV